MDYAEVERTIEHALSSIAGIDGVVEIEDGASIVSGMVESEGSRKAAMMWSPALYRAWR